MQLSAMREYVKKRGWVAALEMKDIGSGASLREKREELLAAARRREVDTIVVWRLDRWGRSLVDLVSTLQELVALKVGFVSLSEALDMTTASGRALAGMLAVFAEFERDILRDRVRAGIAQARKEGKPHGRPQTVTKHSEKVKSLFKKGISKREIAKRLNISRTSVRRLLEPVAKRGLSPIQTVTSFWRGKLWLYLLVPIGKKPLHAAADACGRSVEPGHSRRGSLVRHGAADRSGRQCGAAWAGRIRRRPRFGR